MYNIFEAFTELKLGLKIRDIFLGCLHGSAGPYEVIVAYIVKELISRDFKFSAFEKDVWD